MNHPTGATKRSEWDKRIDRAAVLGERFSYAAEVLGFYRQVLEFQKTLYEQISPESIHQSGSSFREQMDVRAASRQLPALLSLVETNGPAKLALQAGELRPLDSGRQCQMLEDFLRTGDSGNNQTSKPFFARVLFQPYAECFASIQPKLPEGSAGSSCPICGAKPQVAVLRPEGDGGKRFLLCSLCLTEWEFRRILCPICNEEDYQKLPRYSAEDIVAVRVEACDTCKYYLKSVDMTIDGLAVPLIDEVATVPLDLWATEHGYKKAEPNIMGF